MADFEKYNKPIDVFPIIFPIFARRREVVLSNSQQCAEIGTVANSLPNFLSFSQTSYV